MLSLVIRISARLYRQCKISSMHRFFQRDDPVLKCCTWTSKTGKTMDQRNNILHKPIVLHTLQAQVIPTIETSLETKARVKT